MPLIPLDTFVGPSAHGGSPDFHVQRTVNMYVEPASAPDASPAALVSFHGYRAIRAFTGPARCALVIENLSFPSQDRMIVAGDGFALRIDGDIEGGATFNVPWNAAWNANSMAYSGEHLAFALGTGGVVANGIVFTDKAFVSSIVVGASTYAARSVVFMDGRFYFIDALTGRVYCTDAYATTINALAFKVAESLPDQPRKLLVVGGELWVFGDASVEVWVNAGSTPFPLESNKSATLHVGCAPNTVQMAGGVPYWVAFDAAGGPQVVRAEGYSLKRISTPAIERRLAAAIDVNPNDARQGSDWRAWIYSKDGHTFYTISCYWADFSVCYDAATNMWFDRASTGALVSGGDDGKHHQDRVNLHVFFNGKHSVSMLFAYPLPSQWPALSNQDTFFYVFDAPGSSLAEFPRIRSTQHFRSPMPVRHNGFALDVMTGNASGFAAASGGSEVNPPRVALRWSDDGGRTFSQERWKPLGHTGNFMERVHWRRLGSARERVYEVAITDPVDAVIMGALLDTEAA